MRGGGSPCGPVEARERRRRGTRGAMRAVIALSLALSAAPLSAHADPVDPRLALLDSDASQARLWFWGFTSIYSVSAVVQTTLALALDDPGLRVDATVGAASSWLGIAGMLITPVPRVWRAAEEAHRTGNVDVAIARAAEAETAARAWYNHVGVGLVAVVSGLVLWIGYDRPISAALAFGSDLIGGELSILTIPTRSARWRDRPVARWQLAPSLNGLQIVGAW